MQRKLEIISSQDLPPHVERNAQLIGLMLFFAKTMTDIDSAIKSGNSVGIAQAVASLLAHGASSFQSGKNLEAQVIATAKQLGFEIDQADLRAIAQA